MQATADMLRSLGADVVTIDDALKDDLGAQWSHPHCALSPSYTAASGLPAPRLALNAVGGASATTLAKVLACVRVVVSMQRRMSFSQAGRRAGDVWRHVAAAGEHSHQLADFQGHCLPGVLAQQPGQGRQPHGRHRARGGHVPGGASAALQVRLRWYVAWHWVYLRTTHKPLDEYQDALEAYYRGFHGAKLMFTPNPDLL